MSYERCASIAVGDRVYYHPVIGEAERKGPYTVRAAGNIPSQPKVAVVWLEGKPGCVAMAALEQVPPGVDLADLLLTLREYLWSEMCRLEISDGADHPAARLFLRVERAIEARG